jgi:Ca-activated chloride channel family protein
MPDAQLHFSQPLWLWALLVIPVTLFWLRYSQTSKHQGLEYRYADEALLPYLTGQARHKPLKPVSTLIAWSLCWALLAIGMAGPRWDFERVSAFQPAAELVVLLDISASMNIRDVRPSRLSRARQEIQDILRLNPGIPIGIVAFATVAHVIAPVTEDMETLKRTLPSLSTDLVHLPGSRLENALQKAQILITGSNHKQARHILLITDGDFTEPNLLDKVDQLTAQNIHLHILAVGTEGGGPLPQGLVPLPKNAPALSRLNTRQLQKLATHGNGLFQLADFNTRDTEKIFKLVLADAEQLQNIDIPTRIWNERFYLLLFPAILLILYLFGGSQRFAGKAI